MFIIIFIRLGPTSYNATILQNLIAVSQNQAVSVDQKASVDVGRRLYVTFTGGIDRR